MQVFFHLFDEAIFRFFLIYQKNEQKKIFIKYKVEVVWNAQSM